MIKSLYPCFRHWSDKGTVWIYSDTHFDDNFIERPSADEQVKLINKKVQKQDTLILLGDVGKKKYVKKLHGYKVLLLGNHDKGVSYYTDVFNEVYPGPLWISEKLILSHERIRPDGLDCAFNIHGHDHYQQDDGTNMYNVCSDVIGYKPLNLNTFIKQGGLSEVKSLHRVAIENAVERADERGFSLNNKKYDLSNIKIGIACYTPEDSIYSPIRIRPFFKHQKGWDIIRPKDLENADKIVERVIQARDNPKLYYDLMNGQEIIQRGINTDVSTACNASSLVRECIIEAVGKPISQFITSNERWVLTNYYPQLFINIGRFKNLEDTPLFKGDILVTCETGTTCIVVKGMEQFE